MNKKVVLLLFLLFLIPNTVLAYRIPCTTKNLNKLKNAAYSVNITYDFKEGDAIVDVKHVGSTIKLKLESLEYSNDNYNLIEKYKLEDEIIEFRIEVI